VVGLGTAETVDEGSSGVLFVVTERTAVEEVEVGRAEDSMLPEQKIRDSGVESSVDIDHSLLVYYFLTSVVRVDQMV